MKTLAPPEKVPPAPSPATTQCSSLSEEKLLDENSIYQGTGGVSEENQTSGFLPAFRDLETGKVYLSRFADGRCAPMHLLEGLQEEVVLARSAEGRITAIKKSIIAGFVRLGHFYTRDQAAAALSM